MVFAIAVWLWIFAPLDDTYVAIGAALALVLFGAVPATTFFATLGHQIIWLLIGSFVIAAAVTATGLPARVAARLVGIARTPRQLVHLVTAALIVTTFAIPSTSGRAALALPVFLGLATVLRDRRRVVLCLALVFPAVILFSAIGSLLGAGAHLITSEILATATGAGMGFLPWLLLGVPLALVWSHLAAEVALLMFTRHSDRRERLRVSLPTSPGPLSLPQRRVIMLLGAVILLWCTESHHGVTPAVVAMVGAVIATAPAMGTTSLSAAVKTIPWTLLLFMAATLCLGIALTATGAAQWIADAAFARIGTNPMVFVVAVLLVSLVAHLVMQSRSARSAVLVPIVVATAPAAGIDVAAAAFLSTAAAGFCLTLTSSAKPVAMFAASDTVPGYQPSHLLKLSAVLAPVSVALLLCFAIWVWPWLGMPLFSH